MQDSLTVSNSETAALDALLRPNHLHGLQEARSAAPKLPGVYAWYFDQVPPGVPVEGCHRVAGHVLLYVGIAPKATKASPTKPSERTLRCRLGDHVAGNAEGSTIRLTLGCLLADTLGIQLRRVGSGRRRTFTNPGERVLDRWMADHARVTWVAVEEPWVVEKLLLAALSLPLNLQGNRHPFVPTLKRIRREAKQRAKAMPVVEDNGGARRLSSPPLP